MRAGVVIYNLIVKYFAGECDPDERELLEEWVDSCPEAGKLFSEISACWNTASMAIPAMKIDKERLWDRISADIRDNT